MKLLKSKEIGKHGYIKLISVYGSDEDIIRTARASYDNFEKPIEKDDYKLIRYLLRKSHTEPFEFPRMTIQVKIPIYLARQWIRHRHGSYNEFSGRYKEMPQEFDYNGELQYKSGINAFETYYEDLATGMPKEKARISLPLGTYTKFVFTMDLHNLLNFIRLRSDESAQKEIRAYSDTIMEWVSEFFPETYNAFIDYIYASFKLSTLEQDILCKFIDFDRLNKFINEIENNKQYERYKKAFGKSELQDFIKKINILNAI